MYIFKMCTFLFKLYLNEVDIENFLNALIWKNYSTHLLLILIISKLKRFFSEF